MKIEAFIIHLERAVERRENVGRILRDCPVPATVVRAVDAQELTEADFRAVYRKDLLQPRYPFEIGKGEIACFLSHRKVWQRIGENNLDGALILEDDVVFDPHMLAKALEIFDLADYRNAYIRFPNKAEREHGTAVATLNGLSLIRPVSPGLGSVGQFVGKEAAARLLEATSVFDRPIDGFLQVLPAHCVPVLAVIPGVIRDASAGFGHSLIQLNKKTIWERIRREVLRFVYRLQVNAANRKWHRSCANG